MKNVEQISQALAILRDTMAPWLCRALKTHIPEYAQDDQLWWSEAVVPFASRFEGEQYRLSQLTRFADRTDALDIDARSADAKRYCSHWRRRYLGRGYCQCAGHDFAAGR